MIKSQRGHIVTVASVAGILGTYKCSDYSATKFAACGFHEVLYTELQVREKRPRLGSSPTQNKNATSHYTILFVPGGK